MASFRPHLCYHSQTHVRIAGMTPTRGSDNLCGHRHGRGVPEAIRFGTGPGDGSGRPTSAPALSYLGARSRVGRCSQLVPLLHPVMPVLNSLTGLPVHVKTFQLRQRHREAMPFPPDHSIQRWPHHVCPNLLDLDAVRRRRLLRGRWRIPAIAVPGLPIVVMTALTPAHDGTFAMRWGRRDSGSRLSLSERDR